MPSLAVPCLAPPGRALPHSYVGLAYQDSGDDRLEALSRSLAAASDIAAVMAIRGAIVTLMGDAAVMLGPRELRIGRQMCRHAEVIVGELLISNRDRRGRRRGDGGERSIAPHWQALARLAPRRSFNVKLAEADTPDGIKALVGEVLVEKRRAQARKHRAGQKIGVVRRMAAERRGGLMLLAGSDDTTIDCRVAARWRRFARMSKSEFGAAVEAGNVKAGRREAREPPAPRLAMMRTPFKLNEFGILSRSIYAVEVSELQR
jgi:hypothetical protein